MHKYRVISITRSTDRSEFNYYRWVPSKWSQLVSICGIGPVVNVTVYTVLSWTFQWVIVRLLRPLPLQHWVVPKGSVDKYLGKRFVAAQHWKLQFPMRAWYLLAIMICTGKYLQIYVSGFEKRCNFAQIGDFGLVCCLECTVNDLHVALYFLL